MEFNVSNDVLAGGTVVIEDDGIDNLFVEVGHLYPCENPF